MIWCCDMLWNVLTTYDLFSLLCAMHLLDQEKQSWSGETKSVHTQLPPLGSITGRRVFTDAMKKIPRTRTSRTPAWGDWRKWGFFTFLRPSAFSTKLSPSWTSFTRGVPRIILTWCRRREIYEIKLHTTKQIQSNLFHKLCIQSGMVWVVIWCYCCHYLL